MWSFWAVVLFAQNFSFTFVSRARNSGSLARHIKASFFSNGIWFVSQIFAVSAFMSILSGKFGYRMAVFAGVFYTTFTIFGSVAAHYFALKNESGKGAVGANNKYAQITVAEWEKVRAWMYRQDAAYAGL
jgi:hypothetical protein